MKIYLRIALLILLSQSLYAQDNNWRTLIGAGYPEYLHIGIGKNLNSKQLLTLSFGQLPSSDNNFFITTLEHSFLIKDSKKNEGLKTWYFGQKINYSQEKSPKKKFQDIILGLDFGRQFYLTRNIGLTFDVGVAFTFTTEKNLDSNGSEPLTENKNNILPTANLGTFYRF